MMFKTRKTRYSRPSGITKQVRKTILSSVLFMLISTPAMARPQLRDLDIRVVLTPQGDARITETRQMVIDSEGTECYIVLGNLNGSNVSNLQVTDETGTAYENVGDWDVNRSRREKTGRCGIITKHDGYELCWGLGESGERTYVTSYTVDGLLRAYEDADGFNYMFVAEGLSPQPDHVRLTIVPEDSVRLTEENTAIWAFRYQGDINLSDGAIVAESSEPFQSRSAMIVMARFQKGIFNPAVQGEGTFDTLREQAFEGSDYLADDEISPMGMFLLVAFFFLMPVLCLALYFLYIWRQRRKVMKDLMWYRDIPYSGNLQTANNVLNAFRYVGADYNNLLSACILRLINLGAISIEQRQNAKGKTQSLFVIHQFNEADTQPKLIRMVHEIFQKAAGSDTVLEPKELSTWMRKEYNQSITDAFVQTLHTKTSLYQYGDELEEVRRLFGLRKYLKEFSLLDERHVHEVALWKDYMVYATLFGIADQVIRDMKKINPDYFNMDQVARQMADETTLPVIRSTMHNSTSRAAMNRAERQARASGRGGSSSWSGGGGFSGGGFGGGVR